MKHTNHNLNAFIILLTSLVFFYMAFSGFKMQNVNLKNLNVSTGYLENYGTDFRIGSKSEKYKIIYIKLKNFENRFVFERTSQDYSDIIRKLKVAEKLTIYSDKKIPEKNKNIDAIQIENSNEIILNKSEFEKDAGTLIFFGLLAGFGIIIYSYLFYKKKVSWKNKHENY
jgi:hypothetical protein